MSKRKYVQSFSVFFLVIGCILISIFVAVQIRNALYASKSGTTQEQQSVILIDPGHGGFDGGTIAADGTVEKDINLSISLYLNDMLRILGYQTEMTRDGDYSICSEDMRSVHDKKVDDMNKRLELYNKSLLTISIHQNYFTQSQYYGTQIFYGLNNANSLTLAQDVRESVVGLLQPDNTRELKKCTSDIYLLHDTTAPAIIVECGFLSNQAELSKLKDTEYQQEMAYTIACGVLTYDP